MLWIRQHPSPGLITDKSKDRCTLDSPGRSFTLPFPQYPKSGQRYLPWNHHYLSSWFSLCWFMLVTQEAQVSRSFLIPCITFHPKWSFTSCFLIQFHTLSSETLQELVVGISKILLFCLLIFPSPCSKGNLALLWRQCFLCSPLMGWLCFSHTLQWKRCPPCPYCYFQAILLSSFPNMPSFDSDINQTMLPTGVGCHALRQGIFLTQGSSLHLLMSAALASKFCATSVPPGKPSLLSCSHYHSPTLLPHDLNTLIDNPSKTLISKIFDLLSSKHLSFVLAHLFPLYPWFSSYLT